MRGEDQRTGCFSSHPSQLEKWVPRGCHLWMELNGETAGTLWSGTPAPASRGSRVIHHMTSLPFMARNGGRLRNRGALVGSSGFPLSQMCPECATGSVWLPGNRSNMGKGSDIPHNQHLLERPELDIIPGPLWCHPSTGLKSHPVYMHNIASSFSSLIRSVLPTSRIITNPTGKSPTSWNN